MFACSTCDSKFKNSRSLYSQKYKYHPKSLGLTTIMHIMPWWTTTDKLGIGPKLTTIDHI